MDVSDGLIGDLGKLCDASGVGAVLDLERLPVSAELARCRTAGDCERLVLSGGDDYELLFTLPGTLAAEIEAMSSPALPLHRIGRIEAGRGVQCRREGRPVTIVEGGYDHFA
jgi:thiamine-monophosphate kinase